MAEQHSSEADRQTAKNYENKWIMARGLSCSHKQGKLTKDNKSTKLQVRPYLLSVPVFAMKILILFF